MATAKGADQGFRWRLADDDGGQPTLFSDEELFDRHVGRGEFRGLEFLHVNAKRIINPVPAQSRMGFRYTINAYRGCSHSCAYCLSGDTPVLMANGRTTPIKDLHVGDSIVGTEQRGRYRRYVATQVLDQWQTFRPAFRTVLDDGTELISSADHRFLSDRGWKYVTGAEHGHARRPFLTSNNHLLGSGRGAESGEHTIVGRTMKNSPVRKVVSVEPLGTTMPLFDITTGTGDFIANGVISHNCFARPTHEYLGLGIGEDFDRKIVVKRNAVERVRAELRSPKWGGDLVAMGTNTDPYQRAEGKYHLTRGVVTALGEAANPFSILTKGTLILRDVDVLTEAASHTDVRCAFSIGTLDEEAWKATEPGTPHPRQRVEAVRKLNEAGIPTGVLIAPIIPGWTDRPEHLEAVAAACIDAGATSITPLALHLRPGVKEHFLSFLAARRPDLAADLHARFGSRSYLPRAQQDAIVRPVQDIGRRRR